MVASRTGMTFPVFYSQARKIHLTSAASDLSRHLLASFTNATLQRGKQVILLVYGFYGMLFIKKTGNEKF